MSITPPTLESEEQFNIICSEKSIHFFNESIKTGQLPSKPTHIWIIIKTVVYEPFSIIARVRDAVGNVFMLLLLPISKGEKQKFAAFTYRSSRLLLDPLDILGKIVATIIRISSAILGVGIPLAGAYGWKWAEQIELWNFTLKEKARKMLAPDSFCPYPLKFHKIEPSNSVRYLGHSQCFEIENKPKSTEEKTKLDQEIKNDFVDFLNYINEKVPTQLEDAFKITPDTRKWIVPILDKLQPSRIVNCDHMIKMTKEILSIEEVDKLSNHVHLKVIFGSGGMKKELVNAGNFIFGQKVDLTDFLEKSNKIDQKLSYSLKFGGAFFPGP